MSSSRTFFRSMVNFLTTGRVVPMIAKSSAERIACIKSLLESGQLRAVIDPFAGDGLCARNGGIRSLAGA
jgi:nucleoside diphosphate kinase